MSYGMKRLADVELLNTTPENANKFVEVDGDVKRVPNKDNGLPTGGAPNQQLVTDAEGVAKWEDQYDAIVRIAGDCYLNDIYDIYSTEQTRYDNLNNPDMFEFRKGDVGTVRALLQPGNTFHVPRVLLIYTYTYEGFDTLAEEIRLMPVHSTNWEGIRYMYFCDGGYYKINLHFASLDESDKVSIIFHWFGR